MKPVWDLLLSSWTTHLLFTAIRLKIFTVLADESMTAADLSSELGAEPRHLKPLLDACTSMDLLLCRGGQYGNSQFSRVHFVEGGPAYIGDFFQLTSRESQQWDKLYDLVKRGEPDPSARHQGEVDPGLFTRAMNNIGMQGEAEALSEAIELGDGKRMVDAGGGSGLYSLFLCRKHRDLTSVVIDRGEALKIAGEVIAGSAEESRITLLEADIASDPLGKELDAVLLSDVLYEASFADKVLKNAKASLRDNGLLVVRGYYSDPEGSRPLFGALFLLNQIVFNPDGSFLTLPSLCRKVTETGFTVTRVDPLTELSFLVVARK